MAAVCAAVAGTAIAAYSANNSRKQGNKASKNQQKAMDQQAEQAQAQLDFNKQQYQDWHDMFYPIAGDLKSMAYEQQRPDFASVAADVGGAFDTSREINARNMERFGVKPTDGAMEAAETGYGLGRAMAEVGGRQAERNRVKDSTWNRLSQVYALGSGQGAQAMQGINAAYGNAQNVSGQQAGAFGNMAAQYGQSAAAGAQAAGYGIGQIASAFNKPAATPTVANSPSWGVTQPSSYPQFTNWGGG